MPVKGHMKRLQRACRLVFHGSGWTGVNLSCGMRVHAYVRAHMCEYACVSAIGFVCAHVRVYA
eukprot:14877290-Alexandrium_andersonii.AAC.1